jgi:dynein heavy chain, axonemal
VLSLDSKSISEVKAYASPPKDIEKVMNAVMTFLGEATGWANVKKQLNDMGFTKRILDFDMANIPKKIMTDIQKYTSKDEFTVFHMTKSSKMAGALCGWVRAVEEYNKAW